jgi:hypothetical protein
MAFVAFLAMTLGFGTFLPIATSLGRKLSRHLSTLAFPQWLAVLVSSLLGVVIAAMVSLAFPAFVLKTLGVIPPDGHGREVEAAKLGIIAGFFLGAVLFKLSKQKRN